MQKISILKVESPACLWGRVVDGSEGGAQTMGQYDHLMEQMNIFYHDVTQDRDKLTPTTLEKGLVCVACSPTLKSWCRVKIEAIITDSVPCQVRCFLLDRGEQLVVSSEQVRVAMPDFLLLPFWVRKFHLSGIKPTRLRVPVNEEKAKMIPSNYWDSSSTLYLHKLLQASTQAEAVLYETEEDSTSMQLYLMVGSIKICVNDELVAKKFAYYSKDRATGSWLDNEDRKVVMLSSNFVNHVVKTKPAFVPQSPPSTAALPLVPVETSSWMLNGCESQSVPNGSVVSEENPNVTAENQFPAIPSSSSSGACAADRDCQEETDSSFAAALTQNISLFKVLKFLNPQSIFNQTAGIFNQGDKPDGLEGTTTVTENCIPPIGIDDCLVDLQLQQLLNEPKSSEASSLSKDEAPEMERSLGSEEHWACSRLLEWLNPEPLNAEVGFEDAETIPVVDTAKNLHLVHSVFPLHPCQTLDDAPITDHLRRLIQRKQLYSLCPADYYSWPAVARGCNTLIISPKADQPISYLPPLLTHVLQNSVFSPTSSTGPMVLVVCPRWEKVQAIFDLLEETKVSHSLNPMIIHVGVKKDEGKSVKIPKNSLLIVTTPFSFVRVLSHHCFLFLRLYHLVLDEADQLFTLAPEQMTTILQHFQKVVSREDKMACPQQIVAVAKQWNNQMDGLITSHMPHPSIIITIPEEAALYANLQQVILMSLESSKINVLLGTLDFNPEFGQKTLIITSSPHEVDDVFEAVGHKSFFCMKCHEGLTHEFDFVVQRWRRSIGPRTHIILVTTDECLRCLGIHDATCVIHYSFPASPRKFGSRLFTMSQNFRNLTEPGSQDKVNNGCKHLAKSVLMISERNTRHVVGVLRYLGRTSALLPSELLSFAQGVYVAREDQKTNRPLCSYLKSFGTCRDSSVCPDRHSWNSRLDKSELPASGIIEVMPLFIKTASVFYGRIATKEENDFGTLATDMTLFYADKKPLATEVLEGALYAVQEEKDFHRVKVLSIPDRGERLFFSVFVQFIDVGKREEVKAHQLLQLPEQFQSVPGQAVEIIVCRVKPADSEKDWHPKVTRAISQKIKGLQHRVHVVFTLGNTIFVDPMLRVTQIPGIKTVINEYSLQSEILSSGLAETNSEHINLLKALCKTDSAISVNKLSGLSIAVSSLENRIQAEEEVLAEFSKAAEVGKLTTALDQPQLKLLRPTSIKPVLPPFVTPPPSPLPLPLILPHRKLLYPQGNQLKITAIPHSSKIFGNLSSSEEVSPQTSPEVQNGITEEQEMAKKETLSSVNTNENAENKEKSLHPAVRWYQSADSLTVTLKLSNPEAPNCQFSTDRVVFRGRVAGKWYEADLDLLRNIDADQCSWKLESNEPVLTLFKEIPLYWEKLVKAKNIFVSYDLDHFEENEDRICNGPSFVEDVGEYNWYVMSETDSDSD